VQRVDALRSADGLRELALRLARERLDFDELAVDDDDRAICSSSRSVCTE
jgi:hypothetical protein